MAIKRNVLLLLIIVSAGALLLAAYWKLPLEFALLGLAVGGLCIYLAVRFPEWFLVAALFAPQWKDISILKPISQAADLTIVMLICLAAGLAWRIGMWLGRMGHEEIGRVFSGQLGPIAAFLVFATLVTVSYSYTNAPLYGGSKLLRFLLIGTILFFAPMFILLTEEDFRRFARLFLGFSAATSVLLITRLEIRSQDAENDITKIGAGWLIGMAILLLLFYPLARSRGRQRALVIFLLPLLLAGLMASAARGPMVALAVAVLLGMGVLLKEGQLHAATAALLLLILAGGTAGAYLVLRQTDLDKYTAKAGEFEVLLTQGASTGSAGKRIAFYRATLSAIPNQPLLGTGIGSWATFYYGNDDRNYPHDLLLEIAFEEGLVGLASFLVLLGVVAMSISRMLLASRFHFLVTGLLVMYCAIVSLFSGDLDDNRVLWLWIGVALAICRLVQLHAAELRSLSRAARWRHSGQPLPAGVPAFSRVATERYSLRKKDRAWREKFVS